MKSELSIRIAGEAGQGTQTIGNVMCRVFKQAGLHIFANQDYMSRVRGGNNHFQIRLSWHPVLALQQTCDIIVALDKASVDLHKTLVRENGIMILDNEKFQIPDADPRFFNVPMQRLAKEIGGNELYVNSVACGVLSGLTGMPFDLVENILSEAFAKKGEEVIATNIRVAREGFDASLKHPSPGSFQIPLRPVSLQLLMNGNEAIALAAIQAGCKFYSAYPMSPSTSIMETVGHYANAYGIVVEQAEDEIAAVNMVIGASFAGVRSMTSTSGGGFALMTEGISLAAMTETPIVVVDAQRPAPATGFPTRTEQADLDFVIHGGHGEFAKIVYTPGSIEEAFLLTQKAFDLSEKYQVPAIILTDQHLADCVRNIDPESLSCQKVQRHVISKEDSRNISSYKRYALTQSGVSPRAIPSWINDVVYADSDEHTEEGHITEDLVTRIQMVEKRFHLRHHLLEQEMMEPVAYRAEQADTFLVGFGSTYGVIREAIDRLDTKNIGAIHLPQVWPFPSTAMCNFLKNAKKVITIENNAGAQLAKLMQREACVSANITITKYDGRPFSVEFLLLKLGQVL